MGGTAEDGIRFAVHVRPGGRRDGVEGEHGGALAVRVTAPAAGGRANEAVRRVLGDAFGVPRTAVEITSGRTARRKQVRIEGAPSVLSDRLERLRRGGD